MKIKSKLLVFAIVAIYAIGSFASTSHSVAKDVKAGVFYEKSVKIDGRNELFFSGIVTDDGEELWGVIARFDGENPSREVALLQTAIMVLIDMEVPSFLITLVIEDSRYSILYADQEVVIFDFPESYLDDWDNESILQEYRDDCLFILNGLSELKISDEIERLFKIEYKQTHLNSPSLPNSVVHDDVHTRITFVGLEEDKYGTVLFKFSVENKTDVKLTFQADTLALDGISLGYISGSDSIAPQSRGFIRFSTEEEVPSFHPKRITGTIKVIDFSRKLLERSQEITFINVPIIEN